MSVALKILIWLVLTLLLTTCAAGRTGAPAPAPGPVDQNDVISRRPATFAESYRWVDGLAVDVVEVDHKRLPPSTPVDSPTARIGDPCSELTVIVRNGTDQMVSIALTARLRYGTDLTQAAAYVATAGHADHATQQFIDPGEVSYPYTLGFVLPAEARDNVVLDLGIDNWKHDHAVFAGSIAGGKH
jgi:hypothetical protein